MERDESIVRSVPEITIHGRGRRATNERPTKETVFKFFCGRQMEIRQKKMLKNCERSDEAQQAESSVKQ
jgi:hypothetical protein